MGTTSEGSLALFGDVFTNAIVVDKVSDTNGIARAKAETVYLEGAQTGQVAVHGAANYDGANQPVSLLQLMPQWYPRHRLRYRLTFTVYDPAGNHSTASLEHRYGSTCGDLPEPVAAHRPGSTAQFLGQAVFTGFEPWANGDVLYENPVTLVWRLPRSNWYHENPYGIEFTPVYQDETYVYMKVKKPLLPAPNSNDGHWSTKTTWGCKAYNDSCCKFSSDGRPPNLPRRATGCRWRVHRLRRHPRSLKNLQQELFCGPKEQWICRRVE